ncbi:MAG: hypothetical protein ACQEQD_00075 [Bacillota bacterium]
MGNELDSINLEKNESNFYIRILFRQNVTYQGTIEWISGNKNQNKKRYFRSLLEMISLINEAVEINNGDNIDYKIRKWEEEVKEDLLHQQ